MRIGGLLLLGACGRFGFGDHPASTDAPGTDVTDVASDAPRGPVARYAMDDDPSSGLVAANSSAFDALCTNCPTSVAGKHGNGYAFDGSMEVRLPAGTSALLGAQPYTVSIWLQPTTATLSGISTVIGKSFSPASDANVYSLWINNAPAGQVFYQTTMTGAAGEYDFIFTPSGEDIRGAWHHVATVWNGTTMQLFVDGTFKAEQANTVIDSSSLALLGADIDNNIVTLHYYGMMDDLEVYDRALSASEIGALANQ